METKTDIVLNKLKIALCISGQPRFYSSISFDSIKKFILDVYDTDVFIHTWFSSDKDFKYNYAPWSGIKGDIIIPKSAKEDILLLYNPKLYLFESPDNKNFENKFVATNYISTNAPYMFYSLTSCDKLRQKYSLENNIIYDWVIRIRFDTLLQSFVNLSEMNKCYFYVPSNCHNKSVYNDNFSFCSSEIADKAYRVFDIIEDEYKNDETKEFIINLIKMPAESIFLYCLRKMNIKVKKSLFLQSFVRGWDNNYDMFNIFDVDDI